MQRCIKRKLATRNSTSRLDGHTGLHPKPLTYLHADMHTDITEITRIRVRFINTSDSSACEQNDGRLLLKEQLLHLSVCNCANMSACMCVLMLVLHMHDGTRVRLDMPAYT